MTGQAWEYKVIDIMAGYAPDVEMSVWLDYVNRTLAHYGSERWELVLILDHCAYFKRCVRDV
jgi:hypothetical protein